jgi:4-hydroxy-3-methylbut-2-enyl diphosphate reductase
MEIILSEPRGFCAGVTRAIDAVEKALEKFGAPIYVKHEIVHNKYVVADLKNKGAIFVEEIGEIPIGAVAIFSAHGVSQKVEDEAKISSLKTIDATCPLVKKVHKKASEYDSKGYRIILIGHKGHPEVEGTSGRIKNNMIIVSTVKEAQDIEITGNKVAYVTQTTLSLDDTKNIVNILTQRFPHIKKSLYGNDVCYATQNRQNAVRKLAKEVDLILVIGSKNSSNSNRLRDLSNECGTASYLINDFTELDEDWLVGVNKVGITAGASAPEFLVQELIIKIKKLYKSEVKISNLDFEGENVRFLLPRELNILS